MVWLDRHGGEEYGEEAEEEEEEEEEEEDDDDDDDDDEMEGEMQDDYEDDEDDEEIDEDEGEDGDGDGEDEAGGEDDDDEEEEERPGRQAKGKVRFAAEAKQGKGKGEGKAGARRGEEKSLEQLMKEMDEFADEAEENADEEDEDMDDLYGDVGGEDDDEDEEGEEEEGLVDDDDEPFPEEEGFEDDEEEGAEDEEDDEGEDDDEEEVADEDTRRARRMAAMDGMNDDSDEGDSEDDGEDGEAEEEGEEGEGRLSEFQLQQRRLRKKIAAMEDASVAAKPWQMRGEVTSKQRPHNSLLEETLEFKQATKAAPVATEEQSRSIEDIIKARIKDELWDDVVRKQAIQPTKFKPKPTEISTEKSTEGLGDVYAREYERQVLGAKPEDEVNKAHEAARQLFAKLSARLDQLTSFHFVPKPFAGTEATVRANVPAISLEEKTPVAMASSTTLAPEEVFGAKRKDKQLADRDELSQPERKALRQQKKRVRRRQDDEREQQQKLLAKVAPDSSAAKKLEAKQTERELEQAKRKGLITTGVLDKPKKGATAKSGGRAEARSDYTKSSQFFKKVNDNVAAGGTAGNKRQRMGSTAGEEGERTSARFKL